MVVLQTYENRVVLCVKQCDPEVPEAEQAANKFGGGVAWVQMWSSVSGWHRPGGSGGSLGGAFY